MVAHEEQTPGNSQCKPGPVGVEHMRMVTRDQGSLIMYPTDAGVSVQHGANNQKIWERVSEWCSK